MLRVAPRKNGGLNGWLQRGGFVLHAVVAAQETKLIGINGLHGAFPRANLFPEDAGNVGDGMKVQMAADVFIAQARAQQQRGSVNRAACDDYSFTAHANALPAARASFDANGAAGFHANALGARLYKKSRARLLRVGEPRFHRGLFRSDAATESAVAADFSLLAADNVARHRRAMPAQRLQAALQNLFARGDAIVFQVDREPRADRIEAARVFFRRKPGNSRVRPLRAYVLRSAKRRAVIDHRAAAQAFSGQQIDTLVPGCRVSRFRVQPLKAAQRVAIKIRVIEIAAGFQNDYVVSRSGEDRRRSCSSRSRSDDAYIADQIQIGRGHRRAQWPRRIGALHAQRARVAKFAAYPTAATVCGGKHDVEQSDGFAQRLKRGAPPFDAAVRPGEHHPFASFWRQRRKRRESAGCKKAVKARIPEIKQLQELRSVRGAGIKFQAARNRIGNAELRCGGPAISRGREGIANGFERAALRCRNVHGVAEMFVKRASVTDRATRQVNRNLRQPLSGN